MKNSKSSITSLRNATRHILTGSIAAASAIALLGGTAAQATPLTWVGATNGVWGLNTNWNPSTTPLAADDLTILGPGNLDGLLNINIAAASAASTINFTDTSAVTLTNTTSGANQTLTLSGAGGITTGTGAVTIGSATANQNINIALGISQTWTVGAGGLTARNVISGTGFGLTKAGTGTLTLNGVNTYTGATTINAGNVVISGTGVIANTATNAININNTGTLTMGRNDTWGSSATGTPLMTTTIAAGGTMTNNGAFFNTLGALTLNGGTLASTGGVNAQFGSWALRGAVTVGGSAASTISQAGTNAQINLGAGSVTGTTFNVADATGDANTDLLVSAVLQNGSNASNVVQASSLTKAGLGTMTLSGANAYTGATTVSAGVLNIQNATALGTVAAGTSVTNGAALQIQGGITVGAEALTLNGTGISITGALRNISGTNVYQGAVTLGSATLINTDAGTLTMSGAFSGAGLGLTVGGAGDTTLSGIIGTTTGTLTKDGAGTLALSGVNTYTGATTISLGTLDIRAQAAASTYSIASPATLSFSTGSAVAGKALTINGAGTLKLNNGVVFGGVSITDTVALSAGGLIWVTNSAGVTASANNTGIWNTNQGSLLVDGGASWNGAASTGNALNPQVDAVNGGGIIRWGFSTFVNTLTVGVANGSGNFSGSLQNTVGVTTGYMALTKTGTGTQTLSGVNTFTGPTTISGGTIVMANPLALQFSAYDTTGSDGATIGLDVSGGLSSGTLTLGGLAGSVNLASAITAGYTGSVTNLTLNPQTGRTTTYAGIIADGSGAMALTKTGAGTQILSGANTYTGATTISAGRLQFAQETSLYNNTPSSWTAANLIISSGGTFGLNVGGTGEFTTGDVTTLLTNLGGANGGTGGGFAAGSTITFDTTNAAGGTFTVADTLVDSFGSGGGAIGLTKIGTNTLVVSGSNSYTGTTTVSSGTLTITSTGALPGFGTSGRYSVASGATLAVYNAVTDGNVATMLGTTNFAAGSALGFDTTSGDRTYAPVLANTAQGVLNLVKLGANTLTLTGTNTYTGTTTVSGGTLVAAGSASATTGAVIVGNTTANAVLNVPTGGAMTGITITAGTTAGSAGAVNVTGGTLTLATTADPDTISFGNVLGGYGAFTISSGTFTQQRFQFGGIGGTATGGTGVGLITGGVVNNSGWLILARSGPADGTLTITGGTLNHGGATQDIAVGLGGGTASANTGRAELNVAGGLIDNTGRRVTFAAGTGGTFHWAGTGVVNLNAGTLLTNSFNYDALSPNASSYVNFGGGVLKASSASTVFLPAFTPDGTGINQVLVNGAFGTFTGGAVIDTNGFDNTISANLLAPTGSGVTSLSIDNAGSGYIGAPSVKILDDGLPSTAAGYAVVGTDATNLATFGKVTSVVITNPGVIAGAATVSLVGGGGTGAAISVASTGVNTSGGLTKQGNGTLTLTGGNTYTGATNVTGGALALVGSGTVSGTSGLSVSSGARFSYLPSVPAALGVGATLTLASNSNIGESFDSTIVASGTATVGGIVNLIPSGSFTSGNTYTLLTAASGLDVGATYNVMNPTNYTFTTTVSGTAVQITPTAATPLATAYWVGGFAGNTGTWAASNGSTASNWTTDGAGTPTPLVPGAAANVIISDVGAGGGDQNAMTLGADMAINSLTVNGFVGTPNNSNPVTLQSSSASFTLTIGGGASPGITVNSGSGSVTLNPNIALASAQTWTNNSDATFSVGTVNNASFALTLAGTGGVAVTGILGGSGALIKTDTGTATLSGANTYSGATTVSAGTLTLSGNRTAQLNNVTVGNLAANTGTLNISNGTFTIGSAGSTFVVGNGDNTVFGIVNQSGGTLTTVGNQLLLGNGAGVASGSAATGTYNLSGGTLNTIASTLGVVLGVNTGTTGNFNLSGTGILNMPATSTLQITRSDNSGANHVTGTFTQTGGTATVGILQIGGSNTTPATANAFANATLNLTGGTFSAVTFNQLSGANSSISSINIGGTADVTLPAFPTARGTSSTATVTFNGGKLRPTAASTTYMGGLTSALIKAGGANIEIASGRDITITQALLNDPTSTGGGLTKTGNPAIGSTLTLTGANTYTGGTTINAGRISVSAAAPLSTGTITITGNSTVGGQLFVGGTPTITNNFILSGVGYPDTVTTANTGRGGAIRAGSGQTYSGTITLAGDARIGVIANTTSNTVSGQITGGFAMDFYGALASNTATQTFILANTGAASNYTGNTSITSIDYASARTGGKAVLQLGASEQIPNGTGTGNLVFNGADANHLTILELNGFNETVNGLSNVAAAGAIIQNTSIGASTLTVGDANTTSSFSGVIKDGGIGRTLAVTKIGNGTLTLTANETYIGATTVNGGTLNVNGTLGAGANVVNANGGVTNFGVSQTLSALNIADGAVAVLGSAPSAPVFDGSEAAILFAGGESNAPELNSGAGALAAAAVPEPGSVALLIGGALAMFGLRGRRKA